MIGAHIDGRYLVQGVLGRGGMAIVYEGIHEQLGRSVAIKVLSAGIALDPVLVERFLREARMASGLSHSNIVEVWDLGRLLDGRPYLVMPKLAGVDFATFLERQGPQSPARVVELLSGVALALDFVHAKGLLHRDVKLENLMHIVREDGSEHVMLMDFGIATAASASPASARLTDYGVVCGTPAYLPPEVAVGAVSDRRADVYALATVAFELMTGRLPFQTDDPLRILPLKATRDAPRMSEVTGHSFPEAIELVIAQGLAFRPEERFSRAGEFVAALEDAVLQSAEELGIAGRQIERFSRPFFGRGSLHSALYTIPEREGPRSLAPAERVTDLPSLRRKSMTPRERSASSRQPQRRGALGTLGWLGCFALAALLAPVIWTAGRSGSRSHVATKEPVAREPEQVWQVRPTSEAAPASSQFESVEDAPVDQPPPTGTPVADGTEPEAQPGAGTHVAMAETQRPPPEQRRVTQPTARTPALPPAPPQTPASAPEAAAAKRAAPSPAVAQPQLPPSPVDGAGPSTVAEHADDSPPSPTAVAPVEETPRQPTPPQPTPPAAVAAADEADDALSNIPSPPRPSSNRASEGTDDKGFSLQPLPPPLDPRPRAQLARVPAPPPLDPARRPETATDAVPREPVSVAKLNEDASAALLGGHLARAAGLYQLATRHDPQNVSAWRGLALTSERLGRNQEAIQAYTRALQLAPSGAQAETLRSRLKNLQGHP